MTYTIHVYEHCPYCVKARMIFGLKNIPVTVKYILNDDVDTPTRMIGAKMVPILEKPDGSFMPESMDIVHFIDQSLGEPILTKQPSNEALSNWLAANKTAIYQLAMPRWAKLSTPLPEFETQGAIDYFTGKKEAYLGESFDALLARSEPLIAELNAQLPALEENAKSANLLAEDTPLTEDTIHLYAALHSLSIVKGITYPPQLEKFRKEMEKASGVPLLDQYAI